MCLAIGLIGWVEPRLCFVVRQSQHSVLRSELSLECWLGRPGQCGPRTDRGTAWLCRSQQQTGISHGMSLIVGAQLHPQSVIPAPFFVSPWNAAESLVFFIEQNKWSPLKAPESSGELYALI